MHVPTNGSYSDGSQYSDIVTRIMWIIQYPAEFNSKIVRIFMACVILFEENFRQNQKKQPITRSDTMLNPWLTRYLVRAFAGGL